MKMKRAGVALRRSESEKKFTQTKLRAEARTNIGYRASVVLKTRCGSVGGGTLAINIPCKSKDVFSLKHFHSVIFMKRLHPVIGQTVYACDVFGIT